MIFIVDCRSPSQSYRQMEDEMLHKPTLGGLRKVQEFFSANGYPLDFFQTDIYKGGQFLGPGGWKASDGITQPLKELGIERLGEEVEDVRLTNLPEKTDHTLFIQFSSLAHLPLYMGMHCQDQGLAVSLETSTEKASPEFAAFVRANSGRIMSLAIWGKESPSRIDKIRFNLTRKRYAEQVFAN